MYLDGLKIANDDKIAVARDDLHWARHSVSSAYKMRMLGDLLPGNGSEKTALRIVKAREWLNRAEAKWRSLTDEPLPPQDDCDLCPQSRTILASVMGKSC